MKVVDVIAIVITVAVLGIGLIGLLWTITEWSLS